MMLRACSGKWGVALINTMDSMRPGWLVGMCSSTIPPELIPIAENRPTPNFSSSRYTSPAASRGVNFFPGLVE